MTLVSCSPSHLKTLDFSDQTPSSKGWITKKALPAIRKIGNTAGKIATISGKVATIASVL
jgi:hypothetical protein